ncbi:hypothetical protein PENTCL1PPCAC_4673 [Pristionchus entomophagus]|uniref:Uncharacterized protein n=1 Tax=Pristionchus entomophagus TaxID=358040 RepID=A0AAV5SPF5_9BILA|nr:hypothetical protein PENTCL1PPCAC_4673 [Pristionchus entomophagus]
MSEDGAAKFVEEKEEVEPEPADVANSKAELAALKAEWESRPPRSASAIAAFVAAQAAAVGLQITGEAISGGWAVTVNFEIANYTNERIHMKGVDLVSGAVEIAPLDITPGDKMKFAARKKMGLHGSEGSMAFEIGEGGEKRVIFIHWIVPLTTAFGGDNYLGIALGKKGLSKNEIYYAFDVNLSSFINRWAVYGFEFYNTNVEYVKIEDKKFAVRGIMGTTTQPTIQIDIVPLDTTQFAEKLKKHIVDSK